MRLASDIISPVSGEPLQAEPFHEHRFQTQPDDTVWGDASDQPAVDNDGRFRAPGVSPQVDDA